VFFAFYGFCFKKEAFRGIPKLTPFRKRKAESLGTGSRGRAKSCSIDSMSQVDRLNFFDTSLNVGAILAGFCATFLSFRIQREAGYFRSPDGKGKDTFSDLSHFTASLLLLLLATVCTAVCGIVLPLLALVGSGPWISPGLIVGGVIGGLLLLAAYFVSELRHYNVFKFLKNDPAEWRREWPLVAVGVIGAALCFWYFGVR
jgi:hypothetical protein